MWWYYILGGVPPTADWSSTTKCDHGQQEKIKNLQHRKNNNLQNKCVNMRMNPLLQV